MAEQDDLQLRPLVSTAAALAPAPAGDDTPAHPLQEANDLGMRPLGGTSPDLGARSLAPEKSWAQRAGEIADDPKSSWMGKAWDIANLPIYNFNKDNQGGFLGGIQDIASSFTSPFQLLLTIGTMGSGGLLETAGGAALKAAGLAASDVEEVTKGAQIVQKTLRAGKSGEAIDTALEAGGVSKSKLNAAEQVLRDAKLNTDSLFHHGIVSSVISSGLRTSGVDIAAAQKVGKTAQGLMDIGFSAQGIYQAAQASPRVLDALREGDYDTAVRLMTVAGFGGVMGLWGGYALSRDAGNAMEEAAAKAGLRVKLTDENNKIRGVIGKYQGDKKTYQNIADNLVEDQRARFKNLTPEEKEGLTYGYQSGFDNEQLLHQHNLLMESAGRDDLKLPVTPNPFPPEDPRTTTGNGNPSVAAAADDFNRARGYRPVVRDFIDTDGRAKDIADAYEAMTHDPKNPAVERSYNALKRDTEEQWDFAQRKLGVKFESWKKEGQPYKDSAEMMKDVRDNKHLWFFQGGDMPADHPMAEVDPRTGLTYNDMFRAVHDFFGHSAEGFEFGPRGEENAWNVHRQMFSEASVPAMTTETRGQNSWVNFGKHLRDANGNIPDKGQDGYIPATKRPYAQQKAGLLPPEFYKRTDELPSLTPTEAALKDHYVPTGDVGFLDRAFNVLQDQAKAARERIEARKTQFGAQYDVGGALALSAAHAQDYAILGAAKIWAGARSFRKFSEEMLAEHGEELHKYPQKVLRDLYQRSKSILWTKIDNGGQQYFVQAKDLQNYLQAGSGIKDWYNDPEFGGLIKKHFGPDSTIFKGFFAATGQGTDLKSNMTQALKAYSQWKSGEPFSGVGLGRQNVERVASGLPLEGKKIGQYGRELGYKVQGKASNAPEFDWGLIPPNVIDRRMVQLFFGKDIHTGEAKVPNVLETKWISAAVSEIASREGLEPKQAQAMLWKAVGDVLNGGEHSSQMPGEVLRNAIRDAMSKQAQQPLFVQGEGEHTLPVPSAGFAPGPGTAQRGDFGGYVKRPVSEQVGKALDRIETETRARINNAKKQYTAMHDIGGAVVLSAEQLRDYAILGGIKIYRGAASFAKWSQEMLDEHGDGLRPYLRDLYEQAKNAVIEALPAGTQSLLRDREWQSKDIVNHIRSGKNYAIMQSENPHNGRLTPEENAVRTKTLLDDLKKYGYEAVPVEGNTKDVQGQTEHAFFVPHMLPEEAVRFGRKYGQSGVLTREGLHWMNDDPSKDYVVPSDNARLIVGNDAASKDYFSVLSPEGERVPVHVPLDDSRQLPPGAPMKLYHGTKAPVSSIEELDATKYGQAHDVAGVGTYFTESPHDAGQYAGDTGKVISGVLRPDTRLLEATNAPMPEAIANAARRVFEKIVRDQNPSLSAQDAFAKYSRSGRDLASADLTYMDVLDAARRFVSEEKGIGVQDKAMLAELKPLQAMLAKNGYDGVRYSNPSGERRGVMVLPSDVSGRPLNDLLKPAGPWSRLTPEESKLWQSEEASRQARYHELAGQGHVKANYSKDEVESVHRAYQAAIGARPEVRRLGRELRDHFGEWFEHAHEKGVIGDAINNYITQIWEKDANNAASNRLASDYRTGNFHTNVSMARERTFANAFEGQLLGRKLAAKDPTAILGNYVNKVGEAIAARDAMDQLRDLGLRASDGRPVVAMAGTGQRVQNEDGSTTVMVNPKSIRNIRIADKVTKGLQKSGDLDRMIEDGKIIKYETKTFDGKSKSSYLWNTHDYRAVDNSAFQGWNWVVQDEEGNNVLVKSELRVHPEANDYLRRFVGAEPSFIRGSRPLSALMKAGSEAKHFLLSLSPFHIAQEGLRAVMSGVSPFGIEKYDLQNDSHLRMGVEEGLTLGKDNKRLDDYMEGLHGGSKVLSKIPGVRNVQEGIEHFLFDKYIPGLKTRAFRSLYDRYKDLNTDGNGVWKEGWNTRRAAREAAAEVNERFGGLNYTQMGRAVGTQDFMRLAALAPDWLESEVRFAMRLFNPEEGVLARRDFAKMTAYTWVTARVLNLLVSGKMHNEAPFGVAVQDNGDSKQKQPLLVYGKPKGLVEPGNIDLSNRPVIQNADGRHSSEYSASFGTDKGEVLVPTVVNGKFLTPDGKKPPEGSDAEKAMFHAALQHYEQTGEHMGIFDTPENADAYARQVHSRRVTPAKGSDGKEKVYSIRTMPTDMLHMVSDPWDFLRGRVSPIGRTAAELYTGRDYAGRKLTPYQTFVDIAKSVAPIPVQGALKAPDVTSPDQIAKALGGTAVTYRTEAEKKAVELASNRTENGPVDQAQLLRHQVKMQFEDELRAGRMAQTDIHQMVENGALSVKEAKEIVKNVTETKGLPPEMASLWLRASRLPMGDFLSVWDAATNDEKAALTKLLLKKKVSYFKNANKDETPVERQNDPTYQRLRRMFPQQPPW
ncbi:MAG: hypothetical protein JWQ87_2022 [Candidatus Sulfotelmatobacter sp.]|nr:hypothetical protein [Candidatus Sulfotelmatobacter sp.]